MTDRVHRDRALPADYQFGDARWRPPHENDAEQLASRDGRHGVTEPLRLFLSTLLDPAQWNVIEGEDH